MCEGSGPPGACVWCDSDKLYYYHFFKLFIFCWAGLSLIGESGDYSSYMWDLPGPGIEPQPLDHQGSPQINLLMNSWQWWWVGREHLLKLGVRKFVFWCSWLLSEFLSHIVVVCEGVLSAFIDGVTFFFLISNCLLEKEKRVAKDEMVGWHYQLTGYKFEQTLGGSAGQRSLACYSLWSRKESDTT